VAAARRCGLDAARLDELRLAVGEACTRALLRCRAADVREPLLLTVDDAGHGLTVEVTDASPTACAEDPVRVALLQGLADAVEVLDGPNGPGGLVRLEWWR
jgi:anti-sigma regulatory factor (Ser/Thr protein kinase)